ncbi:MAG: lamin tail domain-containing protein [Verrucomicrobiales bacterium]
MITTAGAGESGLCISEFMARNLGTAVPGAGAESFEDWIEIHNAGPVAVNLDGWHLTDDPSIPFKWSFPEIEIPADGYLIVFASGEGLTRPSTDLHTNFQLSSSGDYLALTDPLLNTVSAFPESGGTFPEQFADVSYAMVNTLPRHLKKPTPGAANDPEEFVWVKDTQFSVRRGIFTEPFSVEISTDTEGAEIRYTLDSSLPAETTGEIYTGPIRIDTTTILKAQAFKPGFTPTNIDTQTYIFPAKVAQQTAPDGYPTRWGSEPNADYDVDPDVAQSDDYRDRFLQGLRALPVVSISMPVDDLFGTAGIYSRTTTDLEKAGAAEYFRPDTSQDGVNTEAGFSVECGVKIQGGASRNPNSSIKHSMSLRFREQYGTDEVDYPLFDAEEAVTRFNSIHLRAMYNNSWIHSNDAQRNRATMIRDQWMRDTLIEMGNPDAGHGHYCHLYLNGIYWGVYNLHERLDNANYANYFDIADDSTLDNVTPPERPASFNDLRSAVRDRDWPEIVKRMDIDNYIDYYITQHFGHNDDLKTDGNWRAAGGGSSNSLWRFYVWDSERVLENVRATGTLAATSQDGPEFISFLDDIPEFQIRFGDRLQKHFAPGAALTPEASLARWNRYAEMLDIAIVCESARWGDDRRTRPYTRDVEWITEVNKIREDFFSTEEPNRTSYYRDKWEKEQWPSSDSAKYVAGPEFLIDGNPTSGGALGAAEMISFDTSTGSVYYTLDGSDPRVPATVSEPEILLPERVPATAFIPLDDSFANRWHLADFDDSAWLSGLTGVGFDYPDLTGIDASGMQAVNASIFVRVPFTIADQAALEAIGSLTLNMKYEDGFVAFINGVQIASANAPATLSWDSSATTSHPDSQAVLFEEFDATAGVAALNVGTNILAIQLMNSSKSGSDALAMPQLTFESASAAGLSPTAILYTEPLALSTSATVNARKFAASGWSALQTGQFIVEPLPGPGDVTISEFDYHPAAPTETEFLAGLSLASPQTFDEDDFEFIELENTSSHPINLAGLKFSRGITLEIDPYVLPAGQRAVIVRNIDAFVARYGTAPLIAGLYDGNLANSGEAVVLESSTGSPLVTIDYDDKNPWPSAADGNGSSLTLAAGADPSLPSSWSAAAPTPANNSEGGDGYATWAALHFGANADTLGLPNADPDDDTAVNLVEYALGMTPTVAEPSGLPSVSTGAGPIVVMTYRPNPDANDLTLIPESSTDLTSWTTVSAVSTGNDTVTATVSATDGQPIYLRLRVSKP